MKKYITYNEDETKQLGSQIAANLGAGAVVALNGDLGCGKTAFVKGVAEYFGCDGEVSSPTYTLVNEYDAEVPIYHFDVYRISDPEEMYEVGFDEYLESGGVCFIEWAGLIDEILPEERPEITIEKDLSRGFEYRLITRTERKREEERP